MTDLVRKSFFGDSLDHFRDNFFFPIEQEFDRLLTDFFGDKRSLNKLRGKSGYPKMDIVAEKDRWAIRAAIPGVDPKDVKVEIMPESNSVRVSGEMATEYKSPEGSHYMVAELHKSRFSREVVLPDFIEGDPEAEIKDGILTLTWKTVVKEPEIPKPKIIEVKVK
jgi:HSP20 family molecular chaperone IbpA